jgi:hypothetical protein
MYSRKLSVSLSCLAIATAALLSAPPLFAQVELRFSTPASRFTVDRRSEGIATAVPGGLQIQATGRATLYVNANLQMPAGRFEIRRIVVHFRDPKSSDAALKSIQLQDGSVKLLSANTDARGDRSSLEMFKPATVANAWTLPNYVPPITVSFASTVRLEIQSGLNIDPDGPGPPPANYKTPPGEPFILISVDVYVKNPSFKIPGSSSAPAVDNKSRVTPGGAPPAPKPAPAVAVANLPNSNAVIYAITSDNRLLWYRHDGREDGSFRWAGTTGLQVGNGWNFSTVVGAGGGVLYAVSPGGDLIWYRHDGRGDGTFAWAQSEGRKVNSGFTGVQVIAAGGSVLYALKPNGDLLWYRHDGYVDGTDEWNAREGKLVATGWNFSRIFAGDNGTLYGLTAAGDLYRFRHEGHANGENRWTAKAGQKIASGWNYSNVFSSGGGVIYALTPDHQLLWFRDDGRDDDTIHWATATGKVVGVGWSVKTIFSGALLD